MSSTRKKLNRLFKAPSEASVEVFAPRDLDRTPREFDADGGLASTSVSRPIASPRPDATPPPSKAGAVRDERAHAMHTAPWAASAAFESWKTQRGQRAEKTATSLERTIHTGATNAPQADHSIERTRRAHLPAGHVHTLDASHETHRTGMKASQEFTAWKQTRAAHVENPETAKSPLPDDRVRRRAIQSREVFLPEHARQYTLNASRHTVNIGAENARPSVVDDSARPSSTKDITEKHPHDMIKDRADDIDGATQRPKTRLRLTMTPAARTPAERLMWVSAHQKELSDEHMVNTLHALEDAGLRAGHEARRLRMLAETLLRLERDDAALDALESLQEIVPHDAWTLLRLAEVCAKNAGTLEAGLRWCDELLRLHPWISQAQTLRDQIEAKLSAWH